jgi:hypothetical protein
LFSRAHFTYNTTNEDELSIRVNDILHVTDTLYNGQVGYWVATKLNAPSSQNKITGAIPNKSRYTLLNLKKILLEKDFVFS